VRNECRAVILSGERGTGKTTLCLELAGRIEAAEGIVCPALFDDRGNKVGFKCLSVKTGESWQLGQARIKADRNTGRAVFADAASNPANATGSYLFDAAGIKRAVDLIVESIERDDALTLIDEIGPLELRGGGFAPVLPLLAGASDLLLVVRPALVEKILPYLPNHVTRVVFLTELNRESTGREIAKFLNPLPDCN